VDQISPQEGQDIDWLTDWSCRRGERGWLSLQLAGIRDLTCVVDSGASDAMKDIAVQ
jgi:hypothetical protein